MTPQRFAEIKFAIAQSKAGDSGYGDGFWEAAGSDIASDLLEYVLWLEDRLRETGRDNSELLSAHQSYADKVKELDELIRNTIPDRYPNGFTPCKPKA